jgi:prolipoprotein diacylglyceryltransferase
MRWYGVAYVIGIAFAGYMFSRWAKQKRLPTTTVFILML